MTRGIGAIEVLQSAPEFVLAALAVLTWLGSVPVLTAGIVVWYWFGRRRAGGVALAAIIAAAAVTMALKTGFGLARPPDTLHLVSADGFGFPSGHAIAATVGWGTIALAADVGRRRHRFAFATGLVALVGLSRVGLGVHYVVDVLAGIAVGLVLLGVIWRTWSPVEILGIAAGAALLAVFLSGGAVDSTVLVGVSVSTGTGHWLVERRYQPSPPAATVPAIVGATILLGGLSVVVEIGDPAIGLAIGAVMGAIIVGVPVIEPGSIMSPGRGTADR